MARGIPVVTTEVGAEGIVSKEEDILVISSNIDNFAQDMIKTAIDLAQARKRAKNARKLIERKFSWAAITEKLTCIYEGSEEC